MRLSRLFFAITLAVTALYPITLISQPKDSVAMNTLFQFTGEDADPAWASTNDGVMGGLSQGGAMVTAQGLCFAGTLSLENNGGFSSVSTNVTYDLSEFDGVRLKVKGDGRTYQIRFQSDALYRRQWPVNFGAEFSTEAGKWIEVFVPFASLSQSWRGQRLSNYTFNTQKIRRITLMLADKQAGSFNLQVAWIIAE
jgi:monofunctional biosynthetic peptidoglycan transglycosylase